MNNADTSRLEAIIRDCGLGRVMLDDFGDPSKAVNLVRDLLEGAHQEATERGLGDDFFPGDEHSIVAEYDRNPTKVSTLLQILRSTSSPALLVMTWEVLKGENITKINLEYRYLESFTLSFELSSGRQYVSQDIFHSGILKHLGYGTVGEQPFFDGIYPLVRMGE